MRVLQLLCLLVTIVVAVALVPVSGMLVGASKLHIVSTYAELRHAGVIDEGRLSEFREGQLAGDWDNVPYYLLGDSLEGFLHLAWMVSLLLLLDSVFLWKGMRSRRALREQK